MTDRNPCYSPLIPQESAVDFQEIEEALVLIKVSQLDIFHTHLELSYFLRHIVRCWSYNWKPRSQLAHLEEKRPAEIS